ncbi:TetR/AcrR family transcriptional regulator [Microbacterium gilvum]|uniref:TetR/AcrR family transcriptional regulator n=1 Tax=Microbacterium gilvum TaxID=1336204 RepID=A0ABP8ZUI4_9MICO
MSTSSAGTYHHGDLRAALVAAARRALESGETFSLRAVARDVGVSPTAPYRHFADRDALESAVAAEGFRDLRALLLSDDELPATRAAFLEFAVVYVDFAVAHPSLFRVMFGRECDNDADERVRAAAAVHELLTRSTASLFPDRDAEMLGTGLWSATHGLAFLFLDGKLRAASAEDRARRVRATIAALI